MSGNERLFKAKIVQLILSNQTDEAIGLLSDHFRVSVPRLKVGLPKKSRKKIACYVPNTKTIYVASGEKLGDPFVILHEFYHHLRTHGRKHLGTEKHADRFAQEFIAAYRAPTNYSFSVTYR